MYDFIKRAFSKIICEFGDEQLFLETFFFYSCLYNSTYFLKNQRNICHLFIKYPFE